MTTEDDWQSTAIMIADYAQKQAPRGFSAEMVVTSVLSAALIIEVFRFKEGEVSEAEGERNVKEMAKLMLTTYRQIRARSFLGEGMLQ